MRSRQAPELEVVRWLNADEPLSLEALRGKVVVLHAFQVLCAACIHHSIPLARRMQAAFKTDEVVLLGLHSVFENHAAMSDETLGKFVQEQQLTFPIAVDAPDGQGGDPKTMSAYGMQGTPTLVLIDHLGNIRMQKFGQIDDMTVGASVGMLLAERRMTCR